MIGEGRAFHRDPDSRNLATYEPRLLVAGRARLLLHESWGAELPGVGEPQRGEHGRRDAVAVFAVARDLDVRARFERGAPGGVVHHAGDVLEVHLVGKPDEVVDAGVVGDDVGSDAP